MAHWGKKCTVPSSHGATKDLIQRAPQLLKFPTGMLPILRLLSLNNDDHGLHKSAGLCGAKQGGAEIKIHSPEGSLRPTSMRVSSK